MVCGSKGVLGVSECLWLHSISERSDTCMCMVAGVIVNSLILCGCTHSAIMYYIDGEYDPVRL